MKSIHLIVLGLLCLTVFSQLSLIEDNLNVSKGSSSANGTSVELKSNTSTLPAISQINVSNVTTKPISTKPKTVWINFSGRRWSVRRNDVLQNPGPNYFDNSQANVKVDENGYLNLKITKQNDTWKCSSVYLNQSLGYGTYIWLVDKKFSKIDQSAVVGLFSYFNDTAEIDIELSQWGNARKNNTQFVVQPHDTPGNQHRYNSTDKDKDVIHAYKWECGSIKFKSFYGDQIQELTDQIDSFSSSNKQNILRQWVYKGQDIPKNMKLKVVMNFWLYKGKSPVKGVDQEIIIKEFKFLPLKQSNLQSWASNSDCQ